jgi:hypothetical protein
MKKHILFLLLIFLVAAGCDVNNQNSAPTPIPMENTAQPNINNQSGVSVKHLNQTFNLKVNETKIIKDLIEVILTKASLKEVVVKIFKVGNESQAQTLTLTDSLNAQPLSIRFTKEDVELWLSYNYNDKGEYVFNLVDSILMRTY